MYRRKFLERLRELERIGIIKRRLVTEYTVRIEYSLTEMDKGFESVLLSGFFFDEVNAQNCLQGWQVKNAWDRFNLICLLENIDSVR